MPGCCNYNSSEKNDPSVQQNSLSSSKSYHFSYFSEHTSKPKDSKPAIKTGDKSAPFPSADMKAMVWQETFTPTTDYDSMKYQVNATEMEKIKRIAEKLMAQELSRANASTVNVNNSFGFLGIAYGEPLEDTDDLRQYSKLYYQDSVVRFEETVRGNDFKEVKRYYYNDAGNPILMVQTMTNTHTWNWFDYDATGHLKRIIRTDFEGDPLEVTLFLPQPGYASVESYHFTMDHGELKLWEVVKYSDNSARRYTRRNQWRENRLLNSFLDRLRVPEKYGFRSILTIPKLAEPQTKPTRSIQPSADTNVINSVFIGEKIQHLLSNPPVENQSSKTIYSTNYISGGFDFFVSPSIPISTSKPSGNYTKKVFKNGRLIKVHTIPDEYLELFWYDQEGRPLLKSLSIQGNPFSHTFATYDDNGRLTRLTTTNPTFQLLHYTDYIFGSSGLETRTYDRHNLIGNATISQNELEFIINSPKSFGMKKLNIGY